MRIAPGFNPGDKKKRRNRGNQNLKLKKDDVCHEIGYPRLK